MSRGTLYPQRLPEFHRLPPGPDAGELVRWFWIVRWRLPDGETSAQQVIGYPALNLVVEHDRVGLAGPATRAGTRRLTGTGWAVGALLRPAAVPAFTAEPERLRDSYQPFAAPDLHALVAAAITGPGAGGAATAAFGAWLARRIGEPGAEARLANRLVEAAEDPAVQRVGDLAARLSVSERTVQRIARAHVGLTPAALIRRRRLQEAAERLRDDPDTDLAGLAAGLGYADQAHLTHDFVRVLGFTPGRYRHTVTGGAAPRRGRHNLDG